MTHGRTSGTGPGLSSHFALAALMLWALGNSGRCFGEDKFPRLTATLGAGVSAPMGRTADFTHVGGAFAAGLGYRLDPSQSVLLQYYFSGMPFNSSIVDRLGFLKPSSTLYTVTINYRREFRTSGGTRPYMLGGLGWYHRVATITRPTAVSDVICSAGLAWWDLACEQGSIPLDKVVAGSTSNALGFNAGAGLTRRIGKSPFQWYVEARYHYAPYHGVSTHVVPVMIGLAW